MLRCYFKRRHSLAVGLNQAGVSAGQLLLPPFYTFLINQYGWRGALFIISAINMNTLVMGALMRPVRAKRVEKRGRAAEGSGRAEAVWKAEDWELDAAPGQDAGGDGEGGARPSGDPEEPAPSGEEAETTRDTAVLVADDSGSDTDEAGDWPEYPEMHANPVDPFMIAIGAEDRISRASTALSGARPRSPLARLRLLGRVCAAFLLDTYGLRRLTQ